MSIGKTLLAIWQSYDFFMILPLFYLAEASPLWIVRVSLHAILLFLAGTSVIDLQFQALLQSDRLRELPCDLNHAQVKLLRLQDDETACIKKAISTLEQTAEYTLKDLRRTAEAEQANLQMQIQAVGAQMNAIQAKTDQDQRTYLDHCKLADQSLHAECLQYFEAQHKLKSLACDYRRLKKTFEHARISNKNLRQEVAKWQELQLSLPVPIIRSTLYSQARTPNKMSTVKGRVLTPRRNEMFGVSKQELLGHC